MPEVRRLITAGQLQEAEDLCGALLQDDESAVGHHLLSYIAQQTGRYSYLVIHKSARHHRGFEKSVYIQ